MFHFIYLETIGHKQVSRHDTGRTWTSRLSHLNLSGAHTLGYSSYWISRFLLFFLLKGWWPSFLVSEMEWDRDIRWRGITDQLKEMLKCQHQADYARLALRCPLVRWRWKSLPLATETKSWAHRRKTQQGGLVGVRRTGMGVACLYVCICVCVCGSFSLYLTGTEKGSKDLF